MYSNETKNIFINKLSHNLQNQINSIVEATTDARQHLDEASHISGCLDKIDSYTKDLLELLHDALDIVQIQDGMLTLNEEEFSLYGMVERIKQTIEREAAAKGLNFQVSLSNLHHDELLGDPVQVTQVLMNLLSNALKFTPTGGFVELMVVEASTLRADCAQLKFVVRDTGIGMDQATVDSLFAPFSDEKENAPHKRRGLGMLVAKELLDLMGGSIRVQSTPGKGTVFTVELNIKTQSFTSAILPEEEPYSTVAAFNGMRVLIAEDSEVSFTFSRNLLEEAGAVTEHAENGKVALDMFMEKPAGYYKMILMDINMPVMDGFEASKAIRNSGKEDAQTIPIVSMTTNPFANGINTSLESGINAHLSKPLNMVDVYMTIENFL